MEKHITILGNNIRQIRREKDLSQEALAEYADINVTFLGKIERGQANPTIETLLKISNAFTLPVTKLFEYPQNIYGDTDNDNRLEILLSEYADKIKNLYK